MLKNKNARSDSVFLLRWCVDARRYPPAIRRQLMWVGIIAGIGGLGLSAAFLAFTAPSAVLEWVFGAAFVFVGSVGLPLLFLAMATMVCCELGLERHRDDIGCGRCGYSLQGLGDSGECPECGEPYCLTLIRQYWDRLKRERLEALPGAMGCLGLAVIPVVMPVVVMAPGFVFPFVVSSKGGFVLSTVTSLLACVAIYIWIIWHLAIKTSLKTGRLRRRILASGGELCLDCQATLGDSHGKMACEQCGTSWDSEQIDQMKRDWLERLPPHWEEDVAIPARRYAIEAAAQPRDALQQRVER